MEDFEKAIRVSDIEVAEGVAILTDSEQMVAHVTPPVSAASDEEEVSVEDGAEPERVEVTSGEAPPVDVEESAGDIHSESDD